MQFRVLMSMALALTAGACNPWFDYAPKGVSTSLPARAEGTVVDQSPLSCPAKDLQYLVGQPRTVVDTMRFGTEVRFEEPGQMYTQEFKATRTRIVIGTDSKIARILCG